MVPAFFKVSLQRFLWLLGAYSLTRILFMVWNWSRFSDDSLWELGEAFVHGLRFDTSAILFTNILLFAAWMLLPLRWWTRPALRRVDLVLFFVINFFFLGMNFVDAEFVNFIGKRTSFDLFLLTGDLGRHSASVILSYWYFGVGVTALMVFLAWVYPPFPRVVGRREGWIAGVVWRLVELGLLFTGMRGGYQFRPLSPMHAYFSHKHELGLLALNTPFNLIKTQGKGKFQRARYFTDKHEMVRTLYNMSEPTRPALAVARNWNVVVLIVESLSTEYTGIQNPYKGFTPFVDELSKKSFYFHHNFANARRSLEGIPAVLCGLPTMMEEPILTSNFTGDRFECLPKVLQEKGYSTYFLHGTHNGSMHMDKFSGLAGFENFVGLNEYPKGNPEDVDMSWGVLDEPLLQYATGLIDRAPKPVMLSVFTLSSHHPYFIPEKYRGQFPKGSLEIHESIGYADMALRKFFETASTKSWFNNTIFVITADHTHKNDPANKEYAGFIGEYRVPLLIYVPGLKSGSVPYDPKRVTQHVDIVPSVLDLLGVKPSERLLLGQSVFDMGLTGRAYNFTSYSYWYMEPGRVVEMGHPPRPLRTYTFRDIKHLEPVESDGFAPLIQNLKAVVQYMHDGLIENTLYDWRDAL